MYPFNSSPPIHNFGTSVPKTVSNPSFNDSFTSDRCSTRRICEICFLFTSGSFDGIQHPCILSITRFTSIQKYSS